MATKINRTKSTTKLGKVDVSPDMKFYNILDSVPYTVKGALNEYIDNALEAFKRSKKDNIDGLQDKLTITININHDKIVIDDDGPGIPRADIQAAMKPANKKKEQSLSEFGIGMKAASMWFGKKWSLESYPIGSDSPYKIEFDLETLLKSNSEKVDLVPIVSPTKKSGVIITLEKLSPNNSNIEEKQASRAWEEIQETYQLFTSRKTPKPILNLVFKYKNRTLEKKDFSKLIVANKPLNFPECKFKDGKLYAIGKSKIWKQNIQFEFEGKPIYGFISLGEESSQVSNPGLRLFRYGRLIQGMELAPYRPVDLLGTANKAAPSRFYAELHLDGQAISHSKGEFVFDKYLFIEKLKEQDGVLSFIEQAEQYRSTKAEPGQHTVFETWTEFEKETGYKKKTITAEAKKKDTQKNTQAKIKQPDDPITILERLTAPSSFLLLDTFIDDAVRLYKQERLWPFCLVYRAILEVSIIDKIKSLNEDHYDKAKEKSIVALYKYLQSNSQLVPDTYETLKRVLRATNKDYEPFVGLLNITSHGRHIPTRSEVQDFLRNTQQLVEWAFDREI